ncbi:Smr/MutS family protein, partial [Flavobacterium sp.]|uniref:Smr/MutS family protein n=1 Tax=Flavobacterium sp. TaxID=239 RepID=UPI003C6B4ED4
PQGCSLAFLPEWKTLSGGDEVELVKIHLLNETPDSLRFHYEVRTAEKLQIFSLQGTIPPFGNVFLHHISWEQMAAQPRFHWELQPTFGKRLGPSQAGTVHLRPKQLVLRLQRLDETGEPLFSELLVDGFLTMAEPLHLPAHFKLSGASLIMPQQPAIPVVAPYLDLHANVLIGDTAGMQPSEIFRIQLEAVQDYIQLALAHGLREVIIVHGVGSGNLRRAVQELAGSIREVKKLIEEWHPRWGFGATKVKLKG